MVGAATDLLAQQELTRNTKGRSARKRWIRFILVKFCAMSRRSNGVAWKD